MYSCLDRESTKLRNQRGVCHFFAPSSRRSQILVGGVSFAMCADCRRPSRPLVDGRLLGRPLQRRAHTRRRMFSSALCLLALASCIYGLRRPSPTHAAADCETGPSSFVAIPSRVAYRLRLGAAPDPIRAMGLHMSHSKRGINAAWSGRLPCAIVRASRREDNNFFLRHFRLSSTAKYVVGGRACSAETLETKEELDKLSLAGESLSSGQQSCNRGCH